MLSLVHTAQMTSVELDPEITPLTLRQYVGLYSDAFSGLFVVSNAGSLYLVRLDGKAFRVSWMPGGAQSWGGLGYHRERDRAMLVTFYGAIAPVELPSTNNVEPWSADSMGSYSFVVLPDRKLRYMSGRVYTGPIDGPMNTVETTIRGDGVSFGIICPATFKPCRTWWCMDAATGWCDLYDSDDKVVLRSARIAPFRVGGYSPKHDLFVTLSDTYELSVYVNQPHPASLSLPAFDPPPRLGAVSKLSVIVRGADDEPCAGVVVQFAVTAGSLVTDVAETDLTGKAEVTYRAPLAPAADATATATVDEV